MSGQDKKVFYLSASLGFSNYTVLSFANIDHSVISPLPSFLFINILSLDRIYLTTMISGEIEDLLVLT